MLVKPTQDEEAAGLPLLLGAGVPLTVVIPNLATSVRLVGLPAAFLMPEAEAVAGSAGAAAVALVAAVEAAGLGKAVFALEGIARLGAVVLSAETTFFIGVGVCSLVDLVLRLVEAAATGAAALAAAVLGASTLVATDLGAAALGAAALGTAAVDVDAVAATTFLVLVFGGSGLFSATDAAFDTVGGSGTSVMVGIASSSISSSSSMARDIMKLVVVVVLTTGTSLTSFASAAGRTGDSPW